MHSTNNLNDGYVGSGRRLWYSIRKHGIENHVCEHLEFLENREKLREREAEIVDQSLLSDPSCMNLTLGGNGGGDWHGVNKNSEVQRAKGKKANERMAWLRENDPAWVQRSYENHSKGHKESYKAGRIPTPHDWTGRKHRPETIEKMSITAKKRDSSQNSQYNTCWITNGVESKKIKKEESIPDQWRLGRKMKRIPIGP